RSLSVYSDVAGLPNVNNYLDLDPTYKDERGNPLIRMTYDYSDSDRNRAKYIQEKVREVLKEMGADSLSEKDDFEHYDNRHYQAKHNTGGTIMVEYPETSYVNTYLTIYYIDNLYIIVST